MKVKVSFFLIFSFFILSCNNSSKACDCEKDCANSEPILVTPENSISTETLYASYLTFEIDRINKLLTSEDSGQFSEEKKQELENAKQLANIGLLELEGKTGGICPPCPEHPDNICCNGFDFVVLNPNFNKAKLPSLDDYTVLNSGEYIIIPLEHPGNVNIVNLLSLTLTDLTGNDVVVDFKLN